MGSDASRQQQRWTVLDILKWTEAYFHDAALPSARLDAELLLAQVLDLDRIGVYTAYDRPLVEAERAAMRALVVARAGGTPVAYLLGSKDFYTLTLSVDARVLVPRPETECLVDRVLELLEDDSQAEIADVGTGSGYWLPWLSRSVGQAGRVFAVDFDSNAIDFVRERLAVDPLHNVEAVLSRAHDTTLAEDSVDHVLMVNVHFLLTPREIGGQQSPIAQDFPDFYGSIHHALRPDGHLVFLEERIDSGISRGIDADGITEQLGTVGFALTQSFDWNERQYFLIFSPVAVSPTR